jgi:hypothetical protein
VPLFTSHWIVVQRIFKYLKHTLKFGIWYSVSSSLDLVGFSDVDFVGVGLTERSLLVYVIFLFPLLFVGLLENNLQLLNPQ